MRRQTIISITALAGTGLIAAGVFLNYRSVLFSPGHEKPAMYFLT